MALDPAVLEKAHAAEQRVSLVRWAVITVNSLIYIFLMDKAGTIPWLAWTIIIVAQIYALAVIWREPYERYPVMRSVYFTSLTDAGLIALWILGTGGWESPFYVLWYISIVAIAFRFDLSDTMAVSVFYAIAYTGLLGLADELVLTGGQLPVRVGYIFLIGWLSGLISLETYQQTRAKQEMAELAEASGRLSEELDAGSVARNTVQGAMALTGADRGALFLLDEDEALSCVHASGLSDAYVQGITQFYHRTPGAELLDGSKHIQLEDVLVEVEEPMLHHLVVQEGFRTLLVVPLNLEGETVGALSLYRDQVAAFTPEEIGLVRSLAGHASSAIANAHLVEQVTSSEERWRSLVKHAPNIVILLDREGKVRYINRPVEGYDQEEVIGTYAYDWLLGSGPQQLREALQRVFEEGEPASLEAPGAGPHGETAWYTLRLGPLRDGDQVSGALLVAVDITERREMEEELRRSNADLEQFAYVASHDLQEPLRMVTSYVQLLERRYQEELDEDGRTYIQYAVEGSQRMQRLIRDLLAYATLDTGDTVFSAVDLEAVVDEVATSVTAEFEAEGGEVSIGDLPTVHGDESQLRQVFQNLLSNAVKFQRKGVPPRIEVQAYERDDGWEITVSDNGIGVPEDYNEKVFQLFQRLNPRTEYQGTGIGLAICRKVVDRHGGKIWVDESSLGGARFHVTLPGPAAPVREGTRQTSTSRVGPAPAPERGTRTPDPEAET